MKNIDENIYGPTLVIAGPGTGKTTFIVNKLLATIEQIKNPLDGIIVCTFTRKAAEELQHRIYSNIEIKKIGKLNFIIGTIHSICYELLMRYSNSSLSDYQILTEENQTHFIHSKLKNLGFDSSNIKKNGWAVAEELTSVFNKITDNDLDINTADFKAEFDLEDYCKIYPTYLRLLKRFKLFDFATIQKTFIDEFFSDSEFASKVRHNFKYFFVDEYQDVNNIQDKIFKAISAPAYNLTVVGDDDQSIYGFRGSNIEKIINFPTFFQEKNIVCDLKILNTNYRSTSEIVKISNELIEMTIAKRYDKKITAYRNTLSHKPILIEFDDDIQEADFYVELIRELIGQSIISSFNDIAFLFRSVKNHSQKIVDALNKSNIPHQIFGDGGLFSTAMAQEFLAVLDFYLAKDLEKTSIFLDRLAEIDIMFGIDLTSLYTDASYIDKLDDIFDKSKYNSCLGLCYDIFNTIDFLDRYADIGGNIGQLTTIIQSFDDFSDSYDPFNLYSYLVYLKNKQKIDFEFDESISSVKLMTIHQSKGLEFPVVFIPSQNERRKQQSITSKLDSIFELNSLTESDEERRILYVAMTRAEDLLVMSYSKSVFGRKKEYEPSPYFRDIYHQNQNNSKVDLQILTKQNFKRVGQQKISTKNFSYNKLKLYSFCPLAYKFANEWNLATVRIGGLEYGSNIHRIFEKILKEIKNGEVLSRINIADVVEDNWINSSYRSEVENQKFMKIAEKQISTFFINYGDKLTTETIISIEDQFNILIDEVLISGRFDAVIKIDGTDTILDFKTGDFQDYIDQLSFYNLCYIEKYGESDLKCAVYYLKDGTLEYIIPKTNEDVKNKIIKVAKKIENKIFNATPGKHCGDCAYNLVCKMKYTK